MLSVKLLYPHLIVYVDKKQSMIKRLKMLDNQFFSLVNHSLSSVNVFFVKQQFTPFVRSDSSLDIISCIDGVNVTRKIMLQFDKVGVIEEDCMCAVIALFSKRNARILCAFKDNQLKTILH